MIHFNKIYFLFLFFTAIYSAEIEQFVLNQLGMSNEELNFYKNTIKEQISNRLSDSNQAEEYCSVLFPTTKETIGKNPLHKTCVYELRLDENKKIILMQIAPRERNTRVEIQDKNLVNIIKQYNQLFVLSICVKKGNQELTLENINSFGDIATQCANKAKNLTLQTQKKAEPVFLWCEDLFKNNNFQPFIANTSSIIINTVNSNQSKTSDPITLNNYKPKKSKSSNNEPVILNTYKEDQSKFPQSKDPEKDSATKNKLTNNGATKKFNIPYPKITLFLLLTLICIGLHYRTKIHQTIKDFFQKKASVNL